MASKYLIIISLYIKYERNKLVRTDEAKYAVVFIVQIAT